MPQQQMHELGKSMHNTDKNFSFVKDKQKKWNWNIRNENLVWQKSNIVGNFKNRHGESKEIISMLEKKSEQISDKKKRMDEEEKIKETEM